MKQLNFSILDSTQLDFDEISFKLLDSLSGEVAVIESILCDWRENIETDRVYDHISEAKFLLKKLKKHVSRLDNLKNVKPIKNS